MSGRSKRVWLVSGGLLVLLLLGWFSWNRWGRPPVRSAAPPEPVVFTRTGPPSLFDDRVVLSNAPALLVGETLATGAVVTAPPAPTQSVVNVVTNAPSLDRTPVTHAVLVRTNESPERAQRILEAQIALAQRALSPGSVDGVLGSQTRAALRAFQRKEGLSITGDLDDATQARLPLNAPWLAHYTVTSADRERLRPLARTWLGKSLQARLDYESLLELVAEKSRAHPNLIRRLNPEANWSAVRPGTVLRVPNTAYPPITAKAAYVQIELAARALQVFDSDNRLLAFFPCSIAQRMDKRPVGELHVEVLAANPNYTFDPRIFPESAEARELNRKLILQPGPNNPVGVVWIGLSRRGYGIHGTPQPEQVGRTESHGCFRLANWNADYLRQLAWVGLPVFVRP